MEMLPTQMNSFIPTVETLYAAFDKIAEARKVRSRISRSGGGTNCSPFKIQQVLTLPFCYVCLFKVFKIETIGDCYVAVVGLPVARKNHAVIMARFAADCLRELNQIVNELDLGAGTSELQLRVGLHSGPVTAGVLRGQKARFQLFGGMFLAFCCRLHG
jgi:class 3 adenylate cyclase